MLPRKQTLSHTLRSRRGGDSKSRRSGVGGARRDEEERSWSGREVRLEVT